MDKAIIYCSDCDKIHIQSVKFISQVKMICKLCESENVWLREYKEENPTKIDIKLGGGGCGRRR